MQSEIRENIAIKEPWSLIHPLSPEDSAAMTALRSAVAGMKGKLEFRNLYIRRKPKPLHIANRRKFFPDDLDCGVGHARENFKRSCEVDLIHPFKDEAAHRKPSRRQLRLRSLTHKQRTAHEAHLSSTSVGNTHSTRSPCAVTPAFFTQPRPSGDLGRCELALQGRRPQQARSRRHRRGRR
jgi:hypothetical protein